MFTWFDGHELLALIVSAAAAYLAIGYINYRLSRGPRR